MSKYPKCFPDNFEEDILPKGAKEQEIQVYRIIKYKNIRDNFISSYEEREKGLIPIKKKFNRNDPKIYSTSCFENEADAKYVLNTMMRNHHPEAYIAKGVTAKCCGPCQLTRERSENQHEAKDSHVDWWIYDDATPERHFEL